jgi:putative transposase
MPSRVYERAFYHFIWATWDRRPLLEGEIERHAYALIREQCSEMHCTIHALGGMPDHVHLLVTLPRTLCVADFIESVKGVSSRALNEAHRTDDWTFRWQAGYGFLTVSGSQMSTVIRYIRNQKEHHEKENLWPNAEKTWDEE